MSQAWARVGQQAGVEGYASQLRGSPGGISIDWTAEAEGEQIAIGTSGTHVIYVTLDKPFGKMACPWDNTFHLKQEPIR